MRSLRMYRWFVHDIPFPIFVKTISTSLPHLEELTMPFPYGTDATVLRRLTRLPLRSFSFLKYSPRQDIPDTYVSVDVLPRSLNEIDIHRSPRTDTPFLAVQKLGIRHTALSTFVANATAAFPNVSHLILHGQEIGFIHDIAYSTPLLDDARTRNKAQWDSPQYRKAWPSVSAIWAEHPSHLYVLGFARRVASVSLPMGELLGEEYIGPGLADTTPSFLELRIDVDSFRYMRRDWKSVFRPSIRRVRLLLNTRAPIDEHRVSYMLACFRTMLPGLPSLTHLLVRFAPTPQQPGSALEGQGTRWVYSSSDNTQTVHGAIQKYLCALAGVGPASLRWIGYELFGWGIKAWDISRPAGPGAQVQASVGVGGQGEDAGDAARGHGVKSVKMAEMGEDECRAVVKSEGMDVFKDVRASLVLQY